MNDSIDVAVVRVFTAAHGVHGNELGIVRADSDTIGREQAIAAALDFSETVFIDPVREGVPGGDVASMRIFTPAAELPFAGHPSVGAAWWLKSQQSPITRLVERAGDVDVDYENDVTWITGRAEWAPTFEWTELGSVAELEALTSSDFTAGHYYLYAWIDKDAGTMRSRMFAPDMGVPEDEATGAAAVALTARVGRDLDITQGRGSRLFTQSLPDGYVRVGGYTVFDRTISLSLTGLENR